MINTYKSALLSLALLFLVGCGGGGGDASAPVSKTPDPATLPPVGKDSLVFSYINDVREAIGLAPFQENAKLNTSSQAHAWYISNVPREGDYWAHDENESIAPEGFTGVTPRDRVLAAGHLGYAGEVLTQSRGSYLDGMRGLMTAPYHRISLLSFTADEMGSGDGTGQGLHHYVFDLGMSVMDDMCANAVTYSDRDPYLGYHYGICSDPDLLIEEELYTDTLTAVYDNAPVMTVYPYSDEMGVETTLGTEVPDPLPDVPDGTGNPVSVFFNPKKVTSASVQEFKLFDENMNEVTDVRLLDADTDPHHRLDDTQFLLMPLSPLENDTAYTVTFRYTLDGESLYESWSFKTK